MLVNGATANINKLHWNEKVVSSHILLGMWLPIHAGIQIEHFQYKKAQVFRKQRPTGRSDTS